MSASASSLAFFAVSSDSRIVRSRSSSRPSSGFHATARSTNSRAPNVTIVQKISPKRIETRSINPPLLEEDDQQTHDLGDQGDAFDEGRADDHVGPDGAAGLRLAGDPLQCRGRQTADPIAAANHGDAGAE